MTTREDNALREITKTNKMFKDEHNIETYYDLYSTIMQLSNLTDAWATLENCGDKDAVEVFSLKHTTELLRTCAKMILNCDDYYRK
jgi:5-bromo-4-chloroindolyl phosphate hydrolysis protein